MIPEPHRLRPGLRAGVAALLILAAGAWPARAQDYSAFVPPQDWFLTNSFVGTNGALMASMLGSMQQAAGNGTSSRHPPARATTRADAAALVFTRSPTVTRAVNRRLAAAAARANAAAGANMQRLLESGRLQRSFARLLRKFGYSADNVADVMTADLILSWETVHNGDATRYPHGIAAVNRRLRAALLGNPKIASFSDADKQRFAETLADLAMLDTLARKQLLREGDHARLRRLEAGVRAATRRLGLDVGTMQLTDRGFVKG